MNRVRIVLSGFSIRLLCFVQAKTLCGYGCIYDLLHSCVCVDVMAILSAKTSPEPVPWVVLSLQCKC